MEKFKYEKYDYTKIGIGVFKRFKSTWTVDLSKEINFYFNNDAERELTAIFSKQIAEEIDREILRQISIR